MLNDEVQVQTDHLLLLLTVVRIVTVNGILETRGHPAFARGILVLAHLHR